MYSISVSGGNVVIRNTSNPRPVNQTTIATIASSSNDLTWAFSEDDRRVKLIVNGIALQMAAFHQVIISGVACIDKADFISKITAIMPNVDGVSSPSASVQNNVTAQTSTYTAQSTDYVINCTSGTFTVSLPTAVGISGKEYIVKNTGAGFITIDPNGSQTIDGALTYKIGINESLHLISTGANWITL